MRPKLACNLKLFSPRHAIQIILTTSNSGQVQR
jgi:hypothetical protein